MKSDGKMAVSEWVQDGRFYVDENGLWVQKQSPIDIITHLF